MSIIRKFCHGLLINRHKLVRSTIFVNTGFLSDQLVSFSFGSMRYFVVLSLFISLTDHRQIVSVCFIMWSLINYYFSYTQDISECIIPQWKKNKLREDLKFTKKEMDDADRAMKAGRMQRVCYYYWISLNIFRTYLITIT